LSTTPALRAEQDRPTPALEIRPAGIKDLGTVQSILAEAAAWLTSRRIAQWPTGGFREERTRQRIRQGTVFLAFVAGEPVATITVDRWADPEFWQDTSEDAGYVHRLAVRRPWAGQGIGATLLSWAGRRVAATGGKWLRLDCMRGNKALHGYYEGLGFEHVRDVELGHRISGSLFQRAAE
jgi:GNAT superfamily N-acetyltransferase